MGREVRTLETIEPIGGNNLYLNINLDIQLALEKAYENKKGGAVALETKTGAVLALVSRPSFDPNKFASGIKKEDWLAIRNDKFYPLTNRVIQGGYPPGSTFKLVSAMKALEEEVVTEKTSFLCKGGFTFGNNVFKCSKKGGHGNISVQRAITESCDVFFYITGLKLTVDRIHEMAESIGLGKSTGIDLPGEIKGFVPSTEWKERTKHEKWYEGETVSVSIGQGAVWLTPIQLVQLSSFVANEGVTFKPQIVNRIVSTEGKLIKTFEPVMSTNVKLKKEVFRIVKEGMKGAVNQPNGTAYGSRVQNVSMSGKTGTAQSVGKTGKNLGDHGWFIAFAPADEPVISISVLVEHGGFGAAVSAPIAKLIAETFFKEKAVIKEAKIHGNR